MPDRNNNKTNFPFSILSSSCYCSSCSQSDISIGSDATR